MTEEMRKRLEEAKKEGYKEAIAQAKEWLAINTEEYARIIDGKEYVERKQLLADFESDMNKLWEEKK